MGCHVVKRAHTASIQRAGACPCGEPPCEGAHICSLPFLLATLLAASRTLKIRQPIGRVGQLGPFEDGLELIVVQEGLRGEPKG